MSWLEGAQVRVVGTVSIMVALTTALSAFSPAQEDAAGLRGCIRGLVLDAETQQPIPGAYVGVGEFGDSGGSNRSRHRAMGLFAEATTDAAGRFELDGLAFTDLLNKHLKRHPLVVTHPEYVRYDQEIELPQGGDVPEVIVRLQRAAAIDVKVVDAQGQAVEGIWVFRLEALDGHRFLPPGRDPHMGSFAANTWLQLPRGQSHGFTFTTLQGGRYALDIMQLTMVDKPQPPKIWRSEILYHGGVQLDVATGRTAEVCVAPQANETLLKVQLPEISEQVPAAVKQIPPMVLISRNTGLLLWDSDIVYGPEDERLGRLSKQALYYTGALEDAYLFRNLPPGRYAVFAGPAFCMNAAEVMLDKGQASTLRIPPIDAIKEPSVAVWKLSRDIDLPAGRYTLEDLCRRLSDATENNPRFVAEGAIAEDRITMPGGRLSICQLLEKLYLVSGCTVKEGPKGTLLLSGT